MREGIFLKVTVTQRMYVAVSASPRSSAANNTYVSYATHKRCFYVLLLTRRGSLFYPTIPTMGESRYGNGKQSGVSENRFMDLRMERGKEQLVVNSMSILT